MFWQQLLTDKEAHAKWVAKMKDHPRISAWTIMRSSCQSLRMSAWLMPGEDGQGERGQLAGNDSDTNRVGDW